MSVCTFDTNSVLPPYTPSAIVPSYSPEPGCDERLIEHSPLSKCRAFTGNHVTKSGRDTLVLTEQDPNAELPIYGREAHISGFLSVEDREMVSAVTLKVKGRMEVMFSECGSTTTNVVDEHCTLWSSVVSGGTCPSSIPFSTVLPAQYQDGNSTYPLPPSYSATYSSSGGLYVKVFYILSVTVTRKPSKLRFISHKNTTSVKLNYFPRTRSARPIQQPTSDFLTDVKAMPEEWRQVVAKVNPRPGSTAGPVDLNLFIPAAQIFALGDTIPFHAQLSGPASALREFLPGSGTGKPVLAVTLVRRTLIDIHGRLEPCQAVAGHTTLVSTPPGFTADTHAVLDWAGELRCKADVQVGSFDAGAVKVQDFIAIDIVPSGGAKSPFPRLRHAHPIRLVTESWPDV